MSLRRRVIVGFVVVAVVLIGTNVALASTFHSFLLHRIDRQLTTNGVSFGNREPFHDNDGNNQAPTEYFVAVGDPTSGELTQIGVPFDQRPPPRLSLTVLANHLARGGDDVKPFTAAASSGHGKWRVVALESPRDGGVRVLGISLESLYATQARMREIQIAATLAVLLALGIVSWWTIRLGVYPVAAMADTAEKVTGGDLSLRVEHPDEKTEVGRLGAAFNAMLDRIQQAFRDREASEARVRQFAADASHELRTPLTSIRGYAELWRAGGLDDEESLADAMSRVEAEAKRMGMLVEELLQVARLDQDQPVERTAVDLAGVASDAVADARAVEPDRPIDLEAAPVTVDGNEPALRQVAANLLANVRTHTPAGTPARVIVTQEDGFAELVVADEGPGMDTDVAARVFERFYRADSARTRAAGGTGLGLAIVESIARAHGGSVTVASAPGEGARFTVRIPVTP
jgi:two-component system OmpR family sensor kinase